MTSRTDSDAIEKLKQQLARIEHERWASWQDWMHKICTRNDDGTITIPADLVERWDRQIQTEYADLTDKEKSMDLKEVNRYWWLVEVYVAVECQRARIEWLDEQISHVMFDIYPEDVFTKPTDADYKKANDFDANLHTRLHCDGIRHGLHVLRREVRGLSGRDDLDALSAPAEEGLKS